MTPPEIKTTTIRYYDFTEVCGYVQQFENLDDHISDDAHTIYRKVKDWFEAWYWVQLGEMFSDYNHYPPTELIVEQIPCLEKHLNFEVGSCFYADW